MVHDVFRTSIIRITSWTRSVFLFSLYSREVVLTTDLVAYASLYLSTLPHTSLDAGTWVYSWVISEFLRRPSVLPLSIPLALPKLPCPSLSIANMQAGKRTDNQRSSYFLVYHFISSVLKSVQELYCSYTSYSFNWSIMSFTVIS